MGDFTKEELAELRACSLLHELSEHAYSEFLALSSRITFAKDEILLKEGEHSDHFHYS